MVFKAGKYLSYIININNSLLLKQTKRALKNQGSFTFHLVSSICTVDTKWKHFIKQMTNYNIYGRIIF